MKTIAIRFILLCSLMGGISLLAMAQSAEPALASITYELEHKPDTSDRENVRKTKFRVYLGKGGSRYMNQSMADRMEKAQERIKSMGLQGGVAIGALSINMGPAGGGQEELFMYPSRKELYQIDRLGQTNYMIEQDFPRIDWEIGAETKEIGGFQVQQATGSFGGRNYTVWFAPELPFQYGPWKLHGLPGLILEAEDSTGDVRFTYQGFEKLDAGAAEVALPENAAKATPAQFERAKAAMEQDPSASFRGNIPAGAVTTTRQVVMVSDGNGNRKTLTGDDAVAELERSRLEQLRKNNNPLELPTAGKKKK